MPSFLAEDPGPKPALALDDEASSSAAFLALMRAVFGALRAQTPTVIPVEDALRDLVERSLGVGEVEGEVVGQRRYRFVETVLPGLWRVETRRDDGMLESTHLEVGAIPQVVLAASEEAPRRELPLPDFSAEGLMNAPSLLAEIRHRMGARDPEAPNHVISFTLLPMNEADMTLLEAVLGIGPVQIVSRGYGTCQVQLTGAHHVWSVQHFNAVGNLILDTLEIGGVPAAVLAAPDDLEDAATRLEELLGQGEAS
jgi:hydrogenase-1 operon protein HyaF